MLRGRVRWGRRYSFTRSVVVTQALAAVLFALFATSPFTDFLAGPSVATAIEGEAVELLDERTEASKTFRNPDGTLTTRAFAGPVHFRAETGGWREIDSSVVASARPGFAFENKANRFKVLFRPELGDDHLRFELGGRAFVFGLEGAVKRPLKRQNQGLRYPAAFSGVDVDYQVQPTGVKETLVLRNSQAPTTYRFTLRVADGKRLEAFRLAGDAWGFSFSGRPDPAFVLAAPDVSDGRVSHSREPVSMEVKKVGATFSVVVSLDQAWLRSSERRFPVLLDPTITIRPPTQDSTYFANCSGPTCNLFDYFLQAGTDETIVRRALVQFDLSSVPAGASVTDAKLGLYHSYCVTTESNGWGADCTGLSHSLGVHRLTAAWDPYSSVSSNIAFDSTALSTTTLPAGVTSGWLNWSVTNTVRNWVNGSANYGLLVKRTTEPFDAGGPEFENRNAFEPTRQPKLEVTYASDAVSLYAPDTLHADGAELRWTRFENSTGNPFVGYEIHRSATAGFTPSATTKIATIGDPDTTTYRDSTARPSASFTYKVVQNGAASNERTVALPATGNSTKILQPGPIDGQQTFIERWDWEANCQNYGADDTLWVGDNVSYRDRALLRFDLGDVPSGATVTSAKLRVHTDRDTEEAGTLRAHRVTASWREGSGESTCTGDGATWHETEDGVPWTAEGGDYDPTVAGSVPIPAYEPPTWYEISLGPLAQSWVNGSAPNHGLLLKLASEADTGTWFAAHSDDEPMTPELRPTLEVVYVDGSAPEGPAVTFSAPTAGELLSGTKTVSAAASDDGRVEKVDFYVDNVLTSSDTAAPYEFVWNTTSAANGARTLKAIGTDDAGNTGPPATVPVKVDNSPAPATAVTSPTGTVNGDVTVTATASDNDPITEVEFFLDGSRFGAVDTAPPYEATLSTLAVDQRAYDGTHTLTTKAYNANGQVTASAPVSISVANGVGTKYRAEITPTEMPATVLYDPAAQTQQQHGLDVTVKNTSTTGWAASQMAVRYRWIAPEATEATTVSGGNAAVPALAAGETTAAPVRLLVDPPALDPGVERSQYRLQVDLFETSTSTWFGAKGNQPAENPVLVKKALATALGLERYYHYVGEELGAGMQQLVNVANGNSIVRWTPFQAPGRGLSTVLDLTYNVLEKKCACPAGNNWSLSISSLTRFGEPLDVHPNNADTIAGRSNKYIEFTDGDGTTHAFTSADGITYQEPEGVHLFLRRYSTTDPTRKWALTRPDRVTFFYDNEGFPTSVEDKNGNRISFTLETTPAGEDPGGPKKRITAITDAGGRAFTIDYWSKAEAKKAHVRGRIQQITDHSGSKLDFDYYEDGNLLRLTQRGGTTADGVSVPDRRFVFTYTDSAGNGPAIATLDQRRKPSERTANQSTRLYSVIDPRSAAQTDVANVKETAFTYLGSGSGNDRWKLASLTNRGGEQTTFAYDNGNRVTTVTQPLTRAWRYGYDSDGKVTAITNPKNQQTGVVWNGERQVVRVNEPGGGYTKYAYNANGYPTSEQAATELNGAGESDDVLSTTTLAYQNIAVDANDVAANWAPGRSIPHISQLIRKTEPNGNAASSTDPDDYEWNFTYTTAGNLETVTEAGPELLTARPKTSYGYDASGNGDLRTITDPRGHVTNLNGYDANGFPTSIVDAENQQTRFSYDSDGQLRFLQDAEHANTTGLETVGDKTVFFYDPFHRLTRQSTPKATGASPELISSSAVYDPNDNVVAQFAPDYGSFTSGAKTEADFDPMDRQTALLTPHDPTNPDPAKAAPRRTEYVYDAAGRLSRVTLPLGLASQTANDYVTELAYDELDRPVKQTRYPASGLLADARVSQHCYDLAGDLRSVTAPRNATETDPAKQFSACPAAVLPFTPTAASYTTKLAYNADHTLKSETDPLGGIRLIEYDANRQVTKTIDEEMREQLRSYTERGQLAQLEETFEPGRAKGTLKTVYRYDLAGNLVLEASPRAVDELGIGGIVSGADYVTETTYDKVNRPTLIRLPKDAATAQAYVHQRYDKTSRLISTSSPVASSLATFMTSTAPADKELRYDVSYFDPGWISQTDDPAKGPVGFDYDAEGRQTLRQPTANKPETWAHFADGLMRSNTDAAGQVTDFVYDLNGNLDRSLDSGVDHATEASLETELDYNGFDEATEIRQREVGETSWQTTQYAFDRNGNLDTRTDEAGASNARAHDFEYDLADRLLWQRDNAGSGCADDRRLSYSYSPADRLLAEVTRVAGAGCGADPATWPVSQQTAYGYTVNGDLKTQQTWNTGTQGEASLLEEHTLGYLTAGGVYLNGNRLTDQFRLKGPDSQCSSAACTATYSYDARERLVRTDNGLPNGFKTTTDYTLDGQAGLPLLGNVTREVTRLTKVGGGVDRIVSDSSYNAASQLLSSGTALASYSGTEPALPTYPLAPTSWQRWNQANGNLKCVTSSATVTLADCQKPESERPTTGIDAWYQFDVRDRMTQYSAAGDKASYVYDGADRVAKQWETHTRGAETRARDTDYTYLGLTSEVVRETHWNALNKQPYEAIGQSGLLQKTRGYGYDAYDRRTTMTSTPNGGSTSSYSYARNVHGDISLLLSSTGTATAAYGYTAYGAEEDGLTTNAESTLGSSFQQTEPLNAFRFNDKRYDTGSLSIDMGARRYGPDVGRFLQSDYYRGALDDLDLSTDPLTNNRYGFAGGNPVSFVEIDGHAPVPSSLARGNPRHLAAVLATAALVRMLYPGARVETEFAIPGAGPRGGIGRADVVAFIPGGPAHVWEIKPNNKRGAREGRAQLRRYVAGLRRMGFRARFGHRLPIRPWVPVIGRNETLTVASGNILVGTRGVEFYTARTLPPRPPTTVPVRFPDRVPHLTFDWRAGLRGGLALTAATATAIYTGPALASLCSRYPSACLRGFAKLAGA